MRIPEIRDYLVELYTTESDILKECKKRGNERPRSSVMITGPPGVGKTVAAYEAAKTLAKKTGRQFVSYSDTEFFDLWSDELTQKGKDILKNPEKYFIYHADPLNLMEPTDLTGRPKDLPALAVMRYLPHFWVKLIHICPGFFVLEDFLDTQRDDTISAGYRIALEGVLGYIPKNENMMIVATSNTPEFSSLSRAMPLPLANRWEVYPVESPTVKEWGNWMNANYEDGWDKRTLVFNMRFENDNYFLRLPDEPETTTNLPTPRSWTALAIKMHYGLFQPEAMLGPEIGGKFRAFCDVTVDIDQLIADPELWSKLGDSGKGTDAKYMTCAMLATWVAQQKTAQERAKSLKLVDAITKDSREYFILVCLCMRKGTLAVYLQQLAEYNKKYERIAKETLSDMGKVLMV